MGSNGYVGVSWGAMDIYTRNGQLSGTGYDSRFVGWLRSHISPSFRRSCGDSDTAKALANQNGPGQVNKLTQFVIEKRVRIGMYGPSIGIQPSLQFTP